MIITGTPDIQVSTTWVSWFLLRICNNFEFLLGRSNNYDESSRRYDDDDDDRNYYSDDGMLLLPRCGTGLNSISF